MRMLGSLLPDSIGEKGAWVAWPLALHPASSWALASTASQNRTLQILASEGEPQPLKRSLPCTEVRDGISFSAPL